MEVVASTECGWQARIAGTVNEASFHAPVALIPASEEDAPCVRVIREQVEVLILGHFSNSLEKCPPRRAEHR